MSQSQERENQPSTLRKVLILIVAILATTLYSTTLLIVSTILPQIQGTLSATADEISWVVTFNILATAIVTPMTGWLVGRFGTRRVMVYSIGGFTLSTLMCGLTDSLGGLVVWRILQGAFGAPSTPLTQSILLDTFPKHQHALVLGLYGFGVVIGPVIGPVLGGAMAEFYTWRWAFFILVPVGTLSVIGLQVFLPRDGALSRKRLDWTGFLALAVALGAIQLVLSRGQRLDWFESGEIIIETVIAALAFWVFVAHTLTTPTPFLNPRHLLNRNYSLGLVLVTIYGMLNFTPMVLLPPLLREHAGFPEGVVGIVIAGRGVGGAIGFLCAGFARRIDPRLSMSIGFGMLMVAGLWLMHVNLDVSVLSLAANALLQGLAIGAIWVPLTVVAFSAVKAEDLAETSAVFHLLRNLGSSFFISVCVAEIVRSTGINYSRMVELVTPFNEILAMPWVHGAWNTDSIAGLAQLSREIKRQSAMIAYLNAFGLFTAACALSLPLVLMVRLKRTPASR
ncbi:MAG: DHA2 family efflux MFS transporter permease subunit [Gammaproteobacteria bacterium]|nr:DHA2 family efflux MFS transporter permease subunit [Gammaproteobacteria bacterium]